MEDYAFKVAKSRKEFKTSPKDIKRKRARKRIAEIEEERQFNKEFNYLDGPD